MTRIVTFSNTIRTVLMVTVLTPAPLLAEPAATARQMLIQAQTRAQDHVVKNAIKRITERGSIPTETPAVFSSNHHEPGAMPAMSTLASEARIELPSQPTLSASRDDSITAPQSSTADPELTSLAAAYQVASAAPWETPQGQVGNSAIVTSPAPATADNVAQAAAPVAAPMAVATTSQDTSAVALPPVTQPANFKPALEKAETPAVEGSTIPPRAETKSETGHDVARKSETAVKPAAKKTTASTRLANSPPLTRQRHARTNSAVEFADSDIRPQLQRIINRPEVRSLMAQYGLK